MSFQRHMGKKHTGSGTASSAPIAVRASAPLKCRWPALLFLVLLGNAALAATLDLTVINVRHRPATELVAVLQPMLAKDASISATAHQLLIRTTQDNLNEIKRALTTLDRPPQPILVTIRQVRISNSHLVRRIVNQPSAGSRASPDDTSDSSAGRIIQTAPRPQYTVEENIRAVEGRWVSVVTADTGTMLFETASFTGDTQGQLAGFYPNRRIQGLDVRAWIQDGEVTVDMHPRRPEGSFNAAGTTHDVSFTTTVIGQLDQWITLGRAVRAVSGQTTPVSANGNAINNSEKLMVQVKVRRSDPQGNDSR